MNTPIARYLGFTGFAILVFMLLLAILGPFIVPYDPNELIAPAFQPPSWSYLLGTNDIGQDIFSELIMSARVSLLVGVVSALIATLFGVIAGLVAGYFGGWAETILMRLVDVKLTLPFLPLMIVVAVFLGPGLITQILVIALVIWAPMARELRSQVLTARRRGFVEAAEAIGAGGRYILRRHLLPNVTPLIIPQFVRAANTGILMETSLSFLGLGDPTVKSWGMMLFYANSRSAFLTDAWLWWLLPPGICITLSVLSFSLLGYALEERVRPRLRTSWRFGASERSANKVRPLKREPQEQDPESPEPLLSVQQLSVEYVTANGAIRAVDSVSFSVRRGEVLGIVGESGSGKTTMAAALMQLLKPPGRLTGGRMLFAGNDLASLDAAELKRLRNNRIALIPQAAMNALNPVYTVQKQLVEAILAHQKIRRSEARIRANHLLQLVGITPDRARAYPHELSGGMRQRVVIAIALANNPSLVIADEPTTGLDVIVQAEILELLTDLQSRLELAMIFISHDLSVVLSVADRIAIMLEGKIVDQSSVNSGVFHPNHPYSQRLQAALPRLKSKHTIPFS
ncbi:dipeptide/oligopeptide/nickel ABC transporter permease/ATP-binding protein [Paenibacillus abyssi]|uniref:Peptide ABC transporter ATP-binding protein n=1 Tax=Paenibacillus abyssi TaxID=1340531 RepID=A0A917CUR4_9BACL|nr:dipeptide/oligopeptide/nickel ABC transporter permease/ATP-binding protein [Paenibacillus abyssi]GGF97703.1 peptide ABC transporter ATP-binding protein [Paenibacillus abyssi]